MSSRFFLFVQVSSSFLLLPLSRLRDLKLVTIDNSNDDDYVANLTLSLCLSTIKTLKKS